MALALPATQPQTGRSRAARRSCLGLQNHVVYRRLLREMSNGRLIERDVKVTGYPGLFGKTLARFTTIELMIATFGVALALVIIIRLIEGPAQRLDTALRATARWSFLWFWLASTSGAMATLFGSSYQALAQRARDFGLAFASAHLAHVGLVAWLLYNSTTPFHGLVFFSIGIFWIYLLALLSIKRFSAMLGPRIRRLVRALGVEYIALVFLVDFAKNPYQDGVLSLVAYLPFQAMAVAGPFLRIAAAVKRVTKERKVATL